MSGEVFDVCVLGAGLGGSTLAAILARQGKRVLLLEAKSHPRFAIGESVVPEFGARARLLAAEFDLPELEAISCFQLVRHRVSASCGVKRNFTFLHHTEGREHEAAHTSQFQAMTYPLGPDSHLYRPDVDQWLTALAVRHGAVYRERAPVRAVDFDAAGATLRSDAGTFRARAVVDGTGHGSVLAAAQGLREEPDLATDTRALFTHAAGVLPIARAREGLARLPVPSPPDQGTLHHLFDGGWFWVIPFDNHSLGVNHACSVGLTLDRRRHPDEGLAAEEEFRHHLARFPTVERQLGAARPLRAFVKTGRLQYRARRLSGPRFCLLPHAASFVDALFSGGLTLTLVGVHEVARALLRALDDDRFDVHTFAAVEASARENVVRLDRMVHGAFLAFRSFPLFDAWYRLWAVANFHGATGLVRCHLRWLERKDPRFLEDAHRAEYRLLLGQGHPRLRALLDEGYALLLRMDAGELGEPATVDRLFDLLRAQEWIPPHFHVAERERRHLASFTLFPLLAIILWGKRHAPPDVRSVYYDSGPVFFRELLRSIGREGWRELSTFGRFFADVHWARGKS